MLILYAARSLEDRAVSEQIMVIRYEVRAEISYCAAERIPGSAGMWHSKPRVGFRLSVPARVLLECLISLHSSGFAIDILHSGIDPREGRLDEL